MTESRFCGNCGKRKPDGDCRMERADFEACVTSMQRPSWKPMNEPEDRQCIDCANMTSDCTCGLSAAAFENCQARDLRYFKPRETPEERVIAWVDEHKARVEAGENAGSKWDDEPDPVNHPQRGKALIKALEIINGERQDSYGNPEDSFELIGDFWTAYLEAQNRIGTGDMISARMVAEMMALFKIARMAGQKTTPDNYADAAGYIGIAGDLV